MRSSNAIGKHSDLVLTDARLESGLCDIVVRDGIISDLRTAGESVPASTHTPTINLGGRTTLPSFVNSHAHLDKAYSEFDEVVADRDGAGDSIRAARRYFRQAKQSASIKRISEGARRVLERALASGTTAIRSHVDVDRFSQLRGMEALLSLQNEYEDRIDIQLVAFPQEGLASEEDRELLSEAVRLGADVVGGCPSADANPIDHIDFVFDVATRHDKPIDIHADVDLDVDYGQLVDLSGYRVPAKSEGAYIAHKAISMGMHGRVVASHMIGLDSMSEAASAATIGLMAAAGLGIVVSPSCSLYLHGRRDQRHVRRGIAPVKRLMEAGIDVAFATDNIRDPYNPFGSANMLAHALLMAYVSHATTPVDLEQVLKMGTTIPARIMRNEVPHSISLGAEANIQVLDARGIVDAISEVAPVLLVMKRGMPLVVSPSLGASGVAP